MTPGQRVPSTTGLADAVSMWRLDPLGNGHAVVAAAAECLAEGIDSPSLRELAGAPPRESQFALEPLIDATMDELGLGHVLAGDPAPAALAAMARRLEAGVVTPQQLAAWAHRTIGHEGPAVCQPIVELDDRYDDVELRGRSAVELDAETRRRAAELLAAADTGEDHR